MDFIALMTMIPVELLWFIVIMIFGYLLLWFLGKLLVTFLIILVPNLSNEKAAVLGSLFTLHLTKKDKS